MRYHAIKLKICDLMRKVQKHAESHVPHLNHALAYTDKIITVNFVLIIIILIIIIIIVILTITIIINLSK